MSTLSYTGERLRRLATQLRYLPRTFAIVREASGRLTYFWISLLVIQGLLPIAIVYLTRAIVNSLVATVRSGAERSAVQHTVMLAIVIGAVMLATQLVRSATTWARLAQSELIRDHIAGLIQQKSLEADVAFYDSSDFYDELHRARAEASYRPIELLEGLGSVLQGSITAVAIFLILIPFGPVLPGALLLSAAPALYVVVKMAHRRHRWRLQTTRDNRRSYYYDELLTEGASAAEMRVFQLGPYFSDRYRVLREKLRHEWLVLARKEAVSEGIAGVGALLVLAAAMAWMTWRAIHGLLSLGDLALFYQAFNQALGLSRTLLESVGRLYENSLFLGNLFAFLDLQPNVVSPPKGRVLPSPIAQGVKFDGVSFRYPGSERYALRDFHLELVPGQTVALVGPNGTGKSTLIKLLCRFYDPESGSISIDGIRLPEFDLEELRRSISVFFQEPVHYNETVSSNIRLGDLRVADREAEAAIRRAASLAGADEVIARLPGRSNTQLGRRFMDGTELSVGEWQRLALARANFRKSPFLILDEPTSAMDPWAELEWAERMRKGTPGRITILITHRFTTAMFADVIHVMSEGQIVESGTHTQLLALGGHYSRGWKTQASMADDMTGRD